jgi:two-component system, OmpR family, alkaline phosphatase synthesis response regulator PhoP
MTPRVLIIDDEPAIVELARLYLERDGFRVESCGTAAEGIAAVERSAPDLVVLDLMLPDGDGFTVCRRIRTFSRVPVLMLTARADDIDKIVGLELGADDYVTKPFNPRELVARVRAILRRDASGSSAEVVLRVGPLRVDQSRHEVWLGDVRLTLREREFALLAAFVRSPGVVLSRERLLDDVWGYEYAGETRTVDVHVNRLRERLHGSGVGIETVRGTGYKLSYLPVGEGEA